MISANRYDVRPYPLGAKLNLVRLMSAFQLALGSNLGYNCASIKVVSSSSSISRLVNRLEAVPGCKERPNSHNLCKNNPPRKGNPTVKSDRNLKLDRRHRIFNLCLDEWDGDVAIAPS